MSVSRLSSRLAPSLLALDAALAAWSWYLRPERAASWAAAGVLLVCMAIAALLAFRWSKLGHDAARRQAAGSITLAVVFAGFIMALSLGVRVAAALGAVEDGSDLSKRITMVMLGAFFVFTGNAMPKTLTPFAAMRCDGARMQAFQRLAGWTWVLMGLAFAIVWLALPVVQAKSVSLALLAAGMLVIAAQALRLRWMRPSA